MKSTHLLLLAPFLALPALRAAKLQEAWNWESESYHYTIQATSRGWYNGHTGAGSPGTAYANSYAVGGWSGANYIVFRNFFVFDLPDGQTDFTSAWLQLYNESYTSQNSFEGYSLYDVSTPSSNILAGTGGIGVYNDLGTGTSYGNYNVTAATAGQWINIPLNTNFINSANASNGGLLALGGAMTTLVGGNQAIFGWFTNANSGVPRLDLTALAHPEADDGFSGSVSISGNTGLVAAPGDNAFGISHRGSAYLFRNVETAIGSITQNVKLIASDGAADDRFGGASISGNIGLIGAFGDDDKGTDSGSAYVYRNLNTANSTISQNAKLLASDGAANDHFANSVCLSGSVGLVGAYEDDTDRGSAYVFRNLDTATGTVTQNAKLISSIRASDNLFGASVRLSGTTGIVGAWGENHQKGAAYLYRDLDIATGTITENAKLAASDGSQFDNFGYSVSLFGSIGLVGTGNSPSQKNTVYLFRDLDTASGTVTQNAKLISTDGGTYDDFGGSVGISGSSAIIGASNWNFQGAAYLFQNLNTVTGTKTEDVKITASGSGYGSNDYFGISVSIDGDNFLIGAPQGDGLVANTGKAYSGSVSSVTTMDQGNASLTISGISFTSRTDWIVGKTTDNNSVTLSFGDSANVSGSNTTVSIGKNSVSESNILDIAGILVAREVRIGDPEGSNSGNKLRLRNTADISGTLAFLLGAKNYLEIEGDYTGIGNLLNYLGGTNLKVWDGTTLQTVSAANYSSLISTSYTSGFTTIAHLVPPPPAVSAGYLHSLFLTTDGTAWSVGSNSGGLLGDGTMISRSTLVQVLPDVKAIAAGSYHSLFLKTDGSVWATGTNDKGQLGDGTNVDRSTAVQILTGVKSIAAGNLHSLFLKTDGSVWATGSNGSGQLGNGTQDSKSTPVQVMTGVEAISAGAYHSLFLKTDGSVWGTGRNSNGQLGYGTTILGVITPVQIFTGARAISAGYYHSLFLKTDATVWATGLNTNGQLGDGTTVNKFTPVQVLTDVKGITAGYYHSLFLKIDASLWATGANFAGQLGDGTTVQKSTPIQVFSDVQAMSGGNAFSLWIKTDGTFWATGDNHLGQLGDGTTVNKSTAVQIYPPPADPGLTWKQRNFGSNVSNPLISAWIADPDHDGLANLLERAFNLNPNQPALPILITGAGTAGLPNIRSTGTGASRRLIIEYLRRKATNNPGLSYIPQFSPDLGAAWQDFAGTETVQSIDTEWERVTVEDPTTGEPKRFGRVKVVAGP